MEELAARLRHRHTLYYSQDDYDGILPAVETERVGLAGDDVSLMWKVFDYASMSACNDKPLRNVSSTVNVVEQQSNQPVAIVPEHVDASTDTSRTQPHYGSSSFDNNASTPLGFATQPAGSFEQPNVSLFDQIPEDWAFTIDDWTLFGAPGSTYFYNEGS